MDRRVLLAARNNADLYEAIFIAHGVAYQRHPFAFLAQAAPPPYYSNLTILKPNHGGTAWAWLADLADQGLRHLSVKDSFSELNLTSDGFQTLFRARWIWREGQACDMPLDWQTVETAEQLLRWEKAWKDNGSPCASHMFSETLLHHPGLAFLAKVEKGEVTAGCIVNRSEGCVGMSNVFAISKSAVTFAEAADAAAAWADTTPLVGYSAGSELGAALASGFKATGDLRVLVTA